MWFGHLWYALFLFDSLDAVEQWGMFEVNFQGPSSGNPFADVEFHATFELQSIDKDTPVFSDHAKAPFQNLDMPDPIMSFNFESGSGSTEINDGSSKSKFPSGTLTQGTPFRSSSIPPGASGESLDFGIDTSTRHALDVPHQGAPFTAFDGLKSFTICGWLNIRDSSMGSGGNRILNQCSGKQCGFDLVWYKGAIKLSIGEWPDNDHPMSGVGTANVDSGWKFFAASYDSLATKKNVKFYFGTENKTVSLDKTSLNTDYKRGAVPSSGLPVAIGAFATYKGNDRMFRGQIYKLQVFGSAANSSGALSLDQITIIQNKTGCVPDCNEKSCGRDGCGGSCGACHSKRQCTNDGQCKLSNVITVRGFYDGDGNYKIRFMPPAVGTWIYKTSSSTKDLDSKTGKVVVSPMSTSRGPVTGKGKHLFYEDGSPYFSVGTTCYAWIHQNATMVKNTLSTLQTTGAGINKMRMCVFPKHYSYNKNEPLRYPYIGTPPTTWDFKQFNVTYWRYLENQVMALGQLGLQADIIVFHPYDGGHWGFDCMGGRNKSSYNTENDDFYLRYLVARLGSLNNVWWSMANEWDFVGCKSKGVDQTPMKSPIWDHLFETLYAEDSYGHEVGIHNGAHLYNHSQPWISHVSLQGHEGDTPSLRVRYGKPTLWDEVRYEGNISQGWGHLSAEEMSDRFWWGNSLGVYVGHGETLLIPGVDNDDQVLWWSKGNILRGGSPKRMLWFRQFMTNTSVHPPFHELKVATTPYASQLQKPGEYYLLHFTQDSGTVTVPLPSGKTCNVEFVDYWNMKIKTLSTGSSGSVKIQIPSLPYNAQILCV